MIVFDIDGTLSPTRPARDWDEPHEIHRAFGFNIAIPNYLLAFLRARQDIALLSTWEEGAASLAHAFDFKATILLPTAVGGIEGKYQRVLAEPQVRAWADDHMRPAMKRSLSERGVRCVKPTTGYVTLAQLRHLAAV